MDADDVALPNRFETQLKYFSRHPDVGIVGGRTLYLYLSGQIKKPSFFCRLKETPPYIQPFENTVRHPAVMVVADLLKKNHYRDDGTALHIEDWELWLRLYSKGVKCVSTDEYLLHYRITDGSINRLYNGVQIDNMSSLSIDYLKKNLGFEIDYKILRYIIGDKTNSATLKTVVKELRNYLRHLKNRFDISDAVASEIELWIYVFCLRELKYKFNASKTAFAKDFLFFLTHFNHKSIRTAFIM